MCLDDVLGGTKEESAQVHLIITETKNNDNAIKLSVYYSLIHLNKYYKLSGNCNKTYWKCILLHNTGSHYSDVFYFM